MNEIEFLAFAVGLNDLADVVVFLGYSLLFLAVVAFSFARARAVYGSSDGPSPESLANCPDCGARIPEDARECEYCGQ